QRRAATGRLRAPQGLALREREEAEAAVTRTGCRRYWAIGCAGGRPLICARSFERRPRILAKPWFTDRTTISRRIENILAKPRPHLADNRRPDQASHGDDGREDEQGAQ